MPAGSENWPSRPSAVLTRRPRRPASRRGKLAQQRAELQQEQQRLRDEEHRQQISGLEKTIGELQRKVQQASQQTQGEAQEVVLRDLLASSFPADTIEDVPKGVHGADVVQGVRGGDGRDCGAIVWESKRTRSWSDGWLPKVRDDQREAGAACAVIVTQTLPPDVRHFGEKEGVWVCVPSPTQSPSGRRCVGDSSRWPWRSVQPRAAARRCGCCTTI